MEKITITECSKCNQTVFADLGCTRVDCAFIAQTSAIEKLQRDEVEKLHNIDKMFDAGAASPKEYNKFLGLSENVEKVKNGEEQKPAKNYLIQAQNSYGINKNIGFTNTAEMGKIISRISQTPADEEISQPDAPEGQNPYSIREQHLLRQITEFAENYIDLMKFNHQTGDEVMQVRSHVFALQQLIATRAMRRIYPLVFLETDNKLRQV